MTKQVGFEQIFDNITLKYMDAMRKQIPNRFNLSLIMFGTTVLDISNVKQIWTMIAGIKLFFGSPIWFALISTRGMI